jgi:hypothetical protein
MPAFRSTLLLALLVGQATAFFVTDKPVKALGPLQSYNRNYDSAGQDGGKFSEVSCLNSDMNEMIIN